MGIMSKFVESDREKLDHCRQITKQALLERRHSISLNGNTFMMWPLFFRSNNSTPESEVEVCTSALGIIAGSKFGLREDNVTTTYTAISDAVSLLLYMRNDDGSWPTHISLVDNGNLIMEGVINDTYYALSALMAIDFLSPNPKIKKDQMYDLKSGQPLSDDQNRRKYIEKSVEWLLNNRVISGWQYTGITYLTNPAITGTLFPAYTTPSAHAIIVLSTVMNQLKNYFPLESDSLIKQIQSAIDETVGWFVNICNQDGGFGVKSSEASRVNNTAKVILALSSVDYSNGLKGQVEKTLQKAVKWLISHYDPKNITAENVYEEFEQIKKTAAGKTYTDNIIHEDFTEPLLIESMIRYKSYCKDKDIAEYKKRKVNNVISLVLNSMLALQVQSGNMRGLVRSHRPVRDQHYTMYSSCDFFCAISLLIESRLDQVIITQKRMITVCSIVLIVIAVIVAGLIAFVKEYPTLSLAAVMKTTAITAVVTTVITGVLQEVLVNLITAIIERHILL